MCQPMCHAVAGHLWKSPEMLGIAKLIGWGVVSIVGVGGTAFGASIMWWGDQVVTALRGWLRIP